MTLLLLHVTLAYAAPIEEPNNSNDEADRYGYSRGYGHAGYYSFPDQETSPNQSVVPDPEPSRMFRSFTNWIGIGLEWLGLSNTYVTHE